MRYITLKELENRKKFLKNRIEKLHAEYVAKALQEEGRRKKEEKEREKIAKKTKRYFIRICILNVILYMKKQNM